MHDRQPRHSLARERTSEREPIWRIPGIARYPLRSLDSAWVVRVADHAKERVEAGCPRTLREQLNQLPLGLARMITPREGVGQTEPVLETRRIAREERAELARGLSYRPDWSNTVASSARTVTLA